MTTRQFPKRRETDEQAARRVERHEHQRIERERLAAERVSAVTEFELLQKAGADERKLAPAYLRAVEATRAFNRGHA